MPILTPVEANAWIYKAEMNLKSASVLIRSGLYDTGYFLTQKAVEMYLKAILSTRETPVPNSGNLIYLLKKIEQYGYPVPLIAEQMCRTINEFKGLSLEPGCYIGEEEVVMITEYAKKIKGLCSSWVGYSLDNVTALYDFDYNYIDDVDLPQKTLLN